MKFGGLPAGREGAFARTLFQSDLKLMKRDCHPVKPELAGQIYPGSG